jgi:hypothetical protein
VRNDRSPVAGCCFYPVFIRAVRLTCSSGGHPFHNGRKLERCHQRRLRRASRRVPRQSKHGPRVSFAGRTRTALSDPPSRELRRLSSERGLGVFRERSKLRARSFGIERPLCIYCGFERRIAHPRALDSAIRTGLPSSTASMASLSPCFVVRSGFSASSI